VLATEYRASWDDFVKEISVFIEEESWYIDVQIVLNAFVGYYLNELHILMLLSQFFKYAIQDYTFRYTKI
jgi:hypothetical protein